MAPASAATAFSNDLSSKAVVLCASAVGGAIDPNTTHDKPQCTRRHVTHDSALKRKLVILRPTHASSSRILERVHNVQRQPLQSLSGTLAAHRNHN